MRSPESEAFSILGLARRSGGVALGIPAVRRAIDAGEARLVVLARDASPTQIRKLGRLEDRTGLRVVEVEDGERLGAAMGHGPLSAAAVTRPAFADRIAECFAGQQRGQGVALSAAERN